MPFGDQRIEHAGKFGARVHEAVGPEQAETLPEQRLAHLLADLGFEIADDQDQAPAAVPQRRMRGVDVARSFLETAATRGRQHVIGATADGFGAQPFLLGEAEDRGADQAFVEFERFEQADQAAQPDAPAARQDGVAKDGNDQRAGVNAALLAEVIETGLQGIAHGVGGRVSANRTTRQPARHPISSDGAGCVSYFYAKDTK